MPLPLPLPLPSYRNQGTGRRIVQEALQAVCGAFGAFSPRQTAHERWEGLLAAV